jgi:methionine-rich copper-binding protein CopC
MPAGAFKDIENNNFAGIIDATTWNFTVKDIIPPTIIALLPLDNAVDVSVETNLEITFNEPVEKGTGNITISHGATSQTIAVASAAVTIAGNKATINPPVKFPAGAEIIIQMPAGVFKDLESNNFEGITDATSWNFTTAAEEDDTPPTITALSPLDNAVDVAINSNLELTFSEPIVKGTGNITINHGTTSQTIAVSDAAVTVAGDKVTINPPADFPSGAAVNVQMPAGVLGCGR